MSESLGKTRSLISCEKGTFAWDSHAQWYGSEDKSNVLVLSGQGLGGHEECFNLHARHSSGYLKGKAKPLSMAAISMHPSDELSEASSGT